MSSAKKDESNLSSLLCVAKKFELPEWATHVAVRNDGSKSEPAAWLESVNDYIDEDPALLDPDCWAGSYKHHYWKFFSRAELDT